MFDLKVITTFPQEIIALDEVGRSPLCGPVVIGVVRVFVEDKSSLTTLLRSLRLRGVKDSKALTTENRRAVLNKLGVMDVSFREKGTFIWKGLMISHVTWEMDHGVIDTENIFEASMRGMKEAALFLSESDKAVTTVLIDGHVKLRWKGEMCRWKEVPVIKGDVKSPLIGLASIIAKEKRDAFMRKMHESWPQYGLDTNMGYPTKFHREAIQIHGPSPIHRRTFNKVKEFIRD